MILFTIFVVESAVSTNAFLLVGCEPPPGVSSLTLVIWTLIFSTPYAAPHRSLGSVLLRPVKAHAICSLWNEKNYGRPEELRTGWGSQTEEDLTREAVGCFLREKIDTFQSILRKPPTITVQLLMIDRCLANNRADVNV